MHPPHRSRRSRCPAATSPVRRHLRLQRSRPRSSRRRLRPTQERCFRRRSHIATRLALARRPSRTFPAASTHSLHVSELLRRRRRRPRDRGHGPCRPSWAHEQMAGRTMQQLLRLCRRRSPAACLSQHPRHLSPLPALHLATSRLQDGALLDVFRTRLLPATSTTTCQARQTTRSRRLWPSLSRLQP